MAWQCLLGWHKAGKAKRTKQGSCNTVRRCIHCKKVLARGKTHKPGPWTKTKRPCVEIQKCTRCKEISGERENHARERNGDTRCSQGGECKKCKRNLPPNGNHDWEDLGVVGEKRGGYSVYGMKCRNCGLFDDNSSGNWQYL